jgi:hypothetical protein
MAARKAAKKSRRPKAQRPKAQSRASSKALRASTSHRRKTIDANPVRIPLPFERFVAAYVELPGRLLSCRTPLQVWFEYLQFGQRVASAMVVPFPIQGHTLSR